MSLAAAAFSAVAAVGVAGGAASSAVTSGRLEGVPALKHVFVIVLENENFATSWGPTSSAHYLNSLRAQGAFADEYFADGHVSADNYMAMTSGQTPTPLFESDCQNWLSCKTFEQTTTGGGRSIADQLQEAHLTWVGAMDSMAVPCQHPSATQVVDPFSVGYATRHDPFVYYPPIVDNPARCASHVRPYSETATALSHDGAVPNFVFISPDTCHDGHDATCPGGKPGGLVSADAWLAANVPPILNSTAYKDNGALFITFDESLPTDLGGCCASGIFANGSNGGGRVGLLALSPLAKVGAVIHHAYDHNSLLRTIEDAFGIHEHLNNAGSPRTSAMTNLFLP